MFDGMARFIMYHYISGSGFSEYTDFQSVASPYNC
jgi:hypothetical protein